MGFCILIYSFDVWCCVFTEIMKYIAALKLLKLEYSC